jgi:DNA-binding response OmpR family regulator
MSILIIEDEADLTDVLSYMMRREGHDVLTALDGETGLRLWRKHNPQLVLLDLGLPRASGWDVCREIYNEAHTPIVIVSGNSGDNEIARGLDLGAEDFITKPFSPRILQARIRAVLRRSAERQPPPARVEDRSHEEQLAIDQRARVIARGRKAVPLTNIELLILNKLIGQRDQVVMHKEVIESVWGYRNEEGSRLIKGHILNLRRKLILLGGCAKIEIIAGVGYLFTERQAEPEPALAG